MKSGARGKGGFTLVELVVTLAITGLAVTAGAGTLAYLADMATRNDPQALADPRQAAGRRVLADLIAGATIGSSSAPLSFSGVDGHAGPHADDLLLFHSTGAAPYVPGVALVGISIDRDPETPEQGLVVRVQAEPGASPIDMALIPDAIELEVKYLFSDGVDRVWLDGWISSAALPAALRLDVTSREGEPYPLLGLPLLVPLGGP